MNKCLFIDAIIKADPDAISSPTLKRRAIGTSICILAFAVVSILFCRFEFQAWIGSGGAYHDGQYLGYWLQALKDPDALTRCRAASALGAIGSANSEVVPALCDVLRRDAFCGPRIEASFALFKIVPSSPQCAPMVVPVLAEALKDRDFQVRMNAVLTLLRLGTQARSALPALQSTLTDPSNRKKLGQYHYSIREWAAVALGRASAGKSDAVAILSSALKDAHTHEMRRAAARGLGEIGVAAKSAVPLLRSLLNEPDADARRAAQEAMRRIEQGVVLAQNYEQPE